MKGIQFLSFLVMISCGSAEKAPSESLPQWIGKGRDEVRSSFSHLTPKTEGNKITYRDTDPIPSAARCSVIPCYPWISGKRVNCTYVFKFENDRVVKATKAGNCRRADKKD